MSLSYGQTAIQFHCLHYTNAVEHMRIYQLTTSEAKSKEQIHSGTNSLRLS